MQHAQFTWHPGRPHKRVTLVDIKVDLENTMYHLHVYSCGHEATIGPYQPDQQEIMIARAKEHIGDVYFCYACGSVASDKENQRDCTNCGGTFHKDCKKVHSCQEVLDKIIAELKGDYFYQEDMIEE
jgi:hypothetical protein